MAYLVHIRFRQHVEVYVSLRDHPVYALADCKIDSTKRYPNEEVAETQVFKFQVDPLVGPQFLYSQEV